MDEELEDSDADVVTTEERPVRQSMFRMPNIKEDIRLLPSIFRSRPILFLPLALLLGGMAITFALPSFSPDVVAIAGYYLQFFFLPPALFTFFVAGFFAPRASYLVGFLYGLVAASIWSIVFINVGVPATDPSQPAAPNAYEPLFVVGNMLVIGILYGTLAAALAAWYRDFLRGIQERGRARRAVKEVDERAKRRELRQEARRVAKQRPTS